MAEHIDSIDELKRALSIEDLRNMSSEKVLELVKLIQNGQVGEIVLPTLFAAAPDTMAKVSQAMADSFQQALSSNKYSSDRLYDSFDKTKSILAQVIDDPNSSEESRRDALDRLERLDDKLMEQDVNNKRFNLQSLQVSKETILIGSVLVASAVVATVSPEVKKLLAQNAPKVLSSTAKMLLPGKK